MKIKILQKKISKKQKTKIEDKIADCFYYNSGYHLINATWCNAKIKNIIMKDDGFICCGEITFGKDNDGDGEKYSKTDDFELFVSNDIKNVRPLNESENKGVQE